MYMYIYMHACVGDSAVISLYVNLFVWCNYTHSMCSVSVLCSLKCNIRYFVTVHDKGGKKFRIVYAQKFISPAKRGEEYTSGIS